MKKPTKEQIMAAEEAHYQFNAKWCKRDFISMQPPWGSFLIEEKPTWAGPSVHMQSIDHVDFYRYDLKEKRDAKFVQLMMEEIAKAVINA